MYLRLALPFRSSLTSKVRYYVLQAVQRLTAFTLIDKHVLSDDEKKTQEYDALAFRYVSYVAIPTLAGYTIYSLVYNTHRGWYSFIISTLTSFVYMFGFVSGWCGYGCDGMCSQMCAGATCSAAYHQLQTEGDNRVP